MTARRPRFRPLVWIPIVLLVGSVLGWLALSPAPLPSPEGTVTATFPISETVYVGVLGPREMRDRSLTVRSIDFEVVGPGTATALVCRGGAIVSTRDATAFCRSLDEVEGATIDFGSGDSLLLRFEARRQGRLLVQGIDLEYRSGFQFGSGRTGPRVEVTALRR